MTELKEVASRLVVGRKRDGRCVYDPKVKEEVVRLCLRPGASVARIAMQCGLNANVLRAWISKRRDVAAVAPVVVVPSDVATAFTPVHIEAAKAASQTPVQTEAQRQLRLQVRLPNGVELDLGEAGAQELAPVIQLLGSLPCSAWTSR